MCPSCLRNKIQDSVFRILPGALLKIVKLIRNTKGGMESVFFTSKLFSQAPNCKTQNPPKNKQNFIISQLAEVNLFLGGTSSMRQPEGARTVSVGLWDLQVHSSSQAGALCGPEEWITCHLPAGGLPSCLGSVTHHIFASRRCPPVVCAVNTLRWTTQVQVRIWPLLECDCSFASQRIGCTVFSKLRFVISLMLFKLHGTYSASAKSFPRINISITYCFTLATDLLQFVGKIEERPNSF